MERVLINKILITFILVLSANAGERFFDSAAISLGMINHSVAPNASALTNTDGTGGTGEAEAAAAAVSAISVQLNWEFKTDIKSSWYVAGALPMMSSEGTGVYSTVIGKNWYFGDIGTKYSYSQNGKTFTVTPSSKYYWGAFVGPGYVVYNTESAKYTDVFFDLGINGGGFWQWGKNRGYRFEATVSRSTGINTTGIKIGIFFGLSQYL